MLTSSSEKSRALIISRLFHADSRKARVRRAAEKPGDVLQIQRHHGGRKERPVCTTKVGDAALFVRDRSRSVHKRSFRIAELRWSDRARPASPAGARFA